MEATGAGALAPCPGKEIWERGFLKEWSRDNWHVPLEAGIVRGQACCRSQGRGKLVTLGKLGVLVPLKWRGAAILEKCTAVYPPTGKN